MHLGSLTTLEITDAELVDIITTISLPTLSIYVPAKWWVVIRPEDLVDPAIYGTCNTSTYKIKTPDNIEIVGIQSAYLSSSSTGDSATSDANEVSSYILSTNVQDNYNVLLYSNI